MSGRQVQTQARRGVAAANIADLTKQAEPERRRSARSREKSAHGPAPVAKQTRKRSSIGASPTGQPVANRKLAFFRRTLARYNTNGSSDTSFDGDGMLTTDFGSSGDVAYSGAILSDGKIVVAGYAGNGTDIDFALARYNTNGSLDTSFDGDGKLITAVGTSFSRASSVAIQADDKIVAFGYALNSGPGNSSDFA